MKRTSRELALAVAVMAAVGVGCQSEPPAAPQAQQSAASGQADSAEVAATPVDSPAEAMTFVSLKVPNMVWGGCAASVRGDLQKIAGITAIKTDTSRQVCSFIVPAGSTDYLAKLEEYAKTNSHLAGYTIDK